MFVFQTTCPFVSSRATTSLPVVTAKNSPEPPGVLPARYRGEAHIFPVNVAANVASCTLAGAAATALFVSMTCVKLPSREACLFRSRTESASGAEVAPPLPGVAPPTPVVAPPAPAVAPPLPVIEPGVPPRPGPAPGLLLQAHPRNRRLQVATLRVRSRLVDVMDWLRLKRARPETVR